MPPRLYSRHALCSAQQDDEGRLFLSDREPYLYRELADNRTHMVAIGDTLWSLAARYFTPMPRPAGLWWIIADFQPEPIFDPTIVLALGTVLVIPSVQVVLEKVLSEERRNEETV